MINWKNKTVKQSFQNMEDLQDSIEQQYILLNQSDIDIDAVKLNLEAIAEAAGVDLTDAAFQGGEQSTESVA